MPLEEIYILRAQLALARISFMQVGKRKQYLLEHMPDDTTISGVWCADLTTGLTGDVGTIEVPGERTDGLQIQPGYDSNAVYNAARDAQLMPAVSLSAPAAYYMRAVLPGWQRWYPTFRYGTIIADSIDFDNDTCDVCLDPAYSTQQNLAVNQNQGFSECDVSPPFGFSRFCVDNPTHPTCTNTEAPGGLHISDAQYAQIQGIQQTVNTEHEYKTDQSGYGVGEQWEIMGPGDSGDCEDYALTKMQDLIDAGYNVKDLQMGWGYTEKGGAHAFLMIQTTNRGVLILDNRYPNIMEKANVPYRFESYQRAGATWSNFTTKLVAVPIEYMECNAVAFADGDSVVVEFTGQDWNSPKVIGFKEFPNSCTQNFYMFGGTRGVDWFIPGGVPNPADPNTYYTGGKKYDVETDSWSDLIYLPGTVDIKNVEEYGNVTFLAVLRAWPIVLSNEAGTAWIMGGTVITNLYWPGSPRPNYLQSVNDRYSAEVWTSRMGLPSPARSMANGFFLNSNSYVCGGTEYYSWPAGEGPQFETYETYDDFDKYNDIADAWTNLPSIGQRHGHASFKIGNNGYLAGGTADSAPSTPSSPNLKNDCREYNPITLSWSGKQDMSGDRYGAAGCHILGLNRGYVVSGDVNRKSHLEFNAVSNAWSTKSILPLFTGFDHGSSVGTGQNLSYHHLNEFPFAMKEWSPDTDSYTDKTKTVITSRGGRFVA